MAMSSCPKCGGHIFELEERAPSGSNFKPQFVQCASCGAVVGAMDYYNIGSLIHQQNEAIKKIASALNVYVDL
jgi:hypothetical protein